MTNIDTVVERARELLVTELRCDGAHLLAGVIENLNDGAILSNPPTSSAIRAIVAALQSTREKKLETLSDVAKTAYIAGAEAVHDCWMKVDPNGPPDRDPDFGEAASDYAALSNPDGEREALPVQGGEEERACRLEQAARELLTGMASTYRARNGREVGIEGDDGEKCWIVHSDLITALEAALPPPAQQPAVGEESGE